MWAILFMISTREPETQQEISAKARFSQRLSYLVEIMNGVKGHVGNCWKYLLRLALSDDTLHAPTPHSWSPSGSLKLENNYWNMSFPNAISLAVFNQPLTDSFAFLLTFFSLGFSSLATQE